MLVKICGINDYKVAESINTFKPDMIGLVFVPTSPRIVTLEQALRIKEALHKSIKIVAVFQNQPLEFVEKIAKQLQVDYVQLHGQEDYAYCARLSVPIIKAINLEATLDQTIQVMNSYKDICKLFLIDRKIQGKGPLVELDQVNHLAARYSILLSGGLTPNNISDILSNASSSIFGVDVSGGVEDNPGSKSSIKIKKFIDTVRTN